MAASFCTQSIYSQSVSTHRVVLVLSRCACNNGTAVASTGKNLDKGAMNVSGIRIDYLLSTRNEAVCSCRWYGLEYLKFVLIIKKKKTDELRQK